nr:putative RNA-directed DNA polymerase [Ipomoea batatas]
MTKIGTGFRTMVRNGRNTKFWEDSWLEDTPLKDIASASIEEADMKILVADMWDNEQGWRWDKVHQMLPKEYHAKLAMVHLENRETEADEVYWRAESSGKLSVTSAYNFLSNNESGLQEDKWERIWKLKVPAKIQTFLWLVYHRRIMCNVERLRRGLTSSAKCSKCVDADETIDHIFRECPMAVDVWTELLSLDIRNKMASLDLDSWLQLNVKGVINSNHGDKWPVVFATAMWWIWRWRNDLAFTGKETPMSGKIELIIEYSRGINMAFANLQYGRNMANKQDVILSWQPPEDNKVVLNIDGSFNVRQHKAGCGGVLRDKAGSWLGGFTSKLMTQHVIESEAWGLLKGMQWAWNKGIRNIEIQMDSKDVINWITGTEQPRGPLRNIIHSCRQWINKSWIVSIKHVYREQNAVADGLAKLALFIANDWNEWHEVPPMVHEMVQRDQERIPHTRRIMRNRS